MTGWEYLALALLALAVFLALWIVHEIPEEP